MTIRKDNQNSKNISYCTLPIVLLCHQKVAFCMLIQYAWHVSGPIFLEITTSPGPGYSKLKLGTLGLCGFPSQ